MGNRAGSRCVAAAVLLCFCLSGTALAHSGRTDANGGHHDRKNVSGLGPYHYHHGHEAHLHPNGVCPYDGGGSTAKTGSKSDAKPKTVHANAVQVSGAPQTVYVDQPFRLAASVAPSGAEERDITWSSSDPSIAAVSERGEVTPKRAGTVNISAKTANGVQKTLTLTIRAIEVTEVSISAEQEAVRLGQTMRLDAAISPNNATNKTVTWTSSDPEVLQVDETGLVKGVALGQAAITATASNGVQGTLEIACVPIPVESVAIELDESVLEGGKLKTEKPMQLKAIVHPENATDPAVKWAVSDPAIAEITADGVLTAKKSGKVTITASCEGEVQDAIEVETRAPSGGVAAGVIGAGVLGAGGWMLYRKKKG